MHRTAAAQISHLYAPVICRLIMGLLGKVPYLAGERGKITAAGQIVNAQVRRHYEARFSG